MRSNIIDYNVVLVILIGAGMLVTVSNTTVVMKSVRPCKAPQAIFLERCLQLCPTTSQGASGDVTIDPRYEKI